MHFIKLSTLCHTSLSTKIEITIARYYVVSQRKVDEIAVEARRAYCDGGLERQTLPP